MKKDLTALFGKFAGREIPVREGYDETTGKTLFVEALNRPEPVFEEMKQEAKSNGLILRVIFPGARITKDALRNRVNARIEKDAGGKWRVSKDFYLG
ncbi:MAG: hypothetical protein ACAH83_03020 [Alphaproteobacteria bacterium]